MRTMNINASVIVLDTKESHNYNTSSVISIYMQLQSIIWNRHTVSGIIAYLEKWLLSKLI